MNPSDKTSKFPWSNKTILCYFLAGLLLLTGLAAVEPGPAEAGTQIVDVAHNSQNLAVGFPHQRRVTRDAYGYWYAVWVHKNGTRYEVRLSKSTDKKGTAWATPVTLAGASGIINADNLTNHWHPTVDMDSSGTVLHLSWTKYSEGIKYSKCTDLTNWNLAASWKRVQGAAGYDSLGVTCYLDSDPTYSQSMAIDSSGNVHIGYVYNTWPFYPMYVYGTTMYALLFVRQERG